MVIAIFVKDGCQIKNIFHVISELVPIIQLTFAKNICSPVLIQI